MKMDKVFPSKWLTASDLEGGDKVVTITKLTQEEVGQEREIKPVMWFQEEEKGLILNVTNWRNLVKICGSDDSDDWSGKQVQLYVAPVQYAGKEVDAIRIRPVGGRRPVAEPQSIPPSTPAMRIDMAVTGTAIRQLKAADGRLGVQIQTETVGTDGKPVLLAAGVAGGAVLDALKNIGGAVASFSLHKHKDGKMTLVSVDPVRASEAPAGPAAADDDQPF